MLWPLRSCRQGTCAALHDCAAFLAHMSMPNASSGGWQEPVLTCRQAATEELEDLKQTAAITHERLGSEAATLDLELAELEVIVPHDGWLLTNIRLAYTSAASRAL